MLARVVVALATAGCGPTMPGAGEAIAEVWGLYAAPGAAPEVDWVTPGCGNGRGFLYGDECLAGLFTGRVALVTIGYRPSDTALCHELWHAGLQATTGNVDPEHTDPGFGTDYGFPFGAVDRAREMLEEAGL